MVELTERFASAQSYAFKVLRVIISSDDPTFKDYKDMGEKCDSWIRSIDEIQKSGLGNNFIFRCHFWLDGNNFDTLDIDIQFSQEHGKNVVPWLSLVRFPHSDRVDRWDFDSLGNIYRVPLAINAK